MKKSQEQAFLEVKQKLDYYRLPTVFPYEAIDLLSHLLSLLDRHARKDGKQNQQSHNSETQNQLNDALRHEMGKTVKQNNRLHMELISAKEEILGLRHHNDKLMIERSGGSKEMTMLLQAQRKREDELFQELTQVKYKYNQLMDLIHEDSEVQKKYIKRLMKHRKMEITQKNQEPSSISHIKKGPHQTVTDLEAKMTLLQNKLANREAEIMRLHKKSQYDGLNMNKILKDFQNHRTDSKVSAMEQQIQYLEQENKKMKQEVNSCRKKGGSKEALRDEMRKNHQTIQKLEKQNKDLKKKVKEKEFDGNATNLQGRRQIQKAKLQAEEKHQAVEDATHQIADLQKKIRFLENENHIAKVAIEKEKKNNDDLMITIEKIKNSDEGDKILGQYEVRSLKQKVEELQVQNQDQKEIIRQLKAENEYHKKEDRLKNEAIENLQKIVDELMKRNNQQAENPQLDYQSNNLENTIALRKNLAEMKQQLAIAQNERQRIERQFETLMVRFDQKSKDSHALNEQLNRLKIRVLEMKNNQEQFAVLQRQVAVLQSDLKKEQNFRYKIDQMHQQAQNDKSRLRKQLQELTQEFQIYQKKSKNLMNNHKMQINELEENNQMLQLMVKEKEKKILILQAHAEEQAGKAKLLKQEIAVLEDQKLTAIRQKHKYQKRCQQMLRVSNQSSSITRQQQQLLATSLHAEILDYQHDIKRLQERIAGQNDQINQLNSYCEAMKQSQDNLLQERAMLRRECEMLRGSKSSGAGEQ